APLTARDVRRNLTDQQRRDPEVCRDRQEARPGDRDGVEAVAGTAELSREHQREEEVHDRRRDVQRNRAEGPEEHGATAAPRAGALEPERRRDPSRETQGRVADRAHAAAPRSVTAARTTATSLASTCRTTPSLTADSLPQPIISRFRKESE